ncbi:MAG: D-alanine--D-alanine ligase family protein [Actinomycetota bacterium]
MARLKVGVIFGGRSVEHDVSIVTAHQAMAALSGRHEIVPIYITKEGRWLTAPALNDLEVYRLGRVAEVGEEAFMPPVTGFGGLHVPGGRLRGSRTISLDAVVCAIHGTYGEDGTLQGVLEMAGLPYTGSGVAASAIGLDKVAMKGAFRAARLPVVPHHLVETRLDADPEAVLDEAERAIGYPVFVKPARAGSSVGIRRADDRMELRDALGIARHYDTRVLVERAMLGCLEINCSVLGGSGREPRVSVCEQPVAWEEFLTFSDKYMRAGKGAKAAQGMASLERRIPAPIPDAVAKQVQDNALRAFRAIDASGVARIDSFVNEETEETWVMEINTMPGSFAFYLWEASDLSFEGLMDELLDIALAEHEERASLMFTFDSGLLEGAPKGKQRG